MSAEADGGKRADAGGAESDRRESSLAKRILIGDPLASAEADQHLLRKRLALPIFASDALSSVAYAPQELLMILLTGGLALLAFSPWIAAAVIVLLLVIVTSYRLLITAYPSGGGDYEVARTNLGGVAGAVVASALLVDYVLTVAVSVASGVDNIISAFPALADWRIESAIGFVVVIVVMNLRGVREASRAFAIPTYVFIASIAIMIVTGLVRTALGDPPVAASAAYGVRAENLTQAAVILLILRAFSSGCSALTGVEAISNGVQAFRKPKVRNAKLTLTMLGAVAATLFAGLTALALIAQVRYAENPCDLEGFDCTASAQPSLVAQIAAATFGMGSAPFYIVQVATACVLLLAANTAFNGFPLLGSVLARDGYAPKALNTRGDRLVYSNGMILLGAAAIGALLIYRANVTSLIHLYIIGVFVAFSLGQIGMIRHWRRRLRSPGRAEARSARRGLLINGIGAGMTILVLVIVTITKFTEGAWPVFLAIPILSLLMLGVRRYYLDVERQTRMDDDVHFGADGDVAVILVSRLQKPVAKAIDYALAARHAETLALHVAVDQADAERLRADWEAHRMPIPLVVIESPYRSYADPVVEFIRRYREDHGPSIVTVYLPQYIVGHWWETLLHNRRARRLAQHLMLVRGVTVTVVPWLLHSSEQLYGRPARPLPGRERAGHPAHAPRSVAPPFRGPATGGER